jgi:hypothetical protein
MCTFPDNNRNNSGSCYLLVATEKDRNVKAYTGISEELYTHGVTQYTIENVKVADKNKLYSIEHTGFLFFYPIYI